MSWTRALAYVGVWLVLTAYYAVSHRGGEAPPARVAVSTPAAEPSGHLGISGEDVVGLVVESGSRRVRATLVGGQWVIAEPPGGRVSSDLIAALVSAGIPVMAHCGLRPQNVHQLGGYKVQRDAQRLLADARAAESAGAFAMVLECIPSSIARQITEAVSIPTIGIGAGRDCDGQVLVLHDVLGITTGYVPRFVRPYANLKETIQTAVTAFRDDVRSGQFPGEEEAYA